VSEFGQRDPRVSAVVSWDRAQSTPLPTDLPLGTPTLFMFADYNCQQVPICEPEAYDTAPDPDGPGNKGDDFLLLQGAGVDTMQVPLRAALHLDWVPSQLSGNRYAEVVTVYYTLAWFDRYGRGATEPDVGADAFDASPPPGSTTRPTGTTSARGSSTPTWPSRRSPTPATFPTA
jgi:hypothetical protein